MNPLNLIYKLRLWQDYDFLNSLALVLIVGKLDILELNVSSKKYFQKGNSQKGNVPGLCPKYKKRKPLGKSMLF